MPKGSLGIAERLTQMEDFLLARRRRHLAKKQGINVKQSIDWFVGRLGRGKRRSVVHLLHDPSYNEYQASSH